MSKQRSTLIVACCSLVSHVKYAPRVILFLQDALLTLEKTDRRTDGRLRSPGEDIVVFLSLFRSLKSLF